MYVEFEIVAEFCGIVFADSFVDALIVDVVYFHAFRHFLLVGGEKVEGMFIYIIYSFEFGAYVYRPAQGAYADFQFSFQFVEDIERIAAFTVEFVDENDDRCVAHAAHFHQFSCLLFDAFCHVDHYYYRIDRSQGAVGVLGEILVTGCVEDIDFIFAVVEAHH